MFNLIIVPILVSLCRQVNLIDISDPRRRANETANVNPPGAKIRDFKPDKGSAREDLQPRKRYTSALIDEKRPPGRPLDILKIDYLLKTHIITKVCFESYTDTKQWIRYEWRERKDSSTKLTIRTDQTLSYFVLIINIMLNRLCKVLLILCFSLS